MIKSNTRYFEVTILLVIILQNGFLNNLPILLLLVPIFINLYFSDWKFRRTNSDEKIITLYGLYLFFISLVNINKLYDPGNVLNIFIQYILIFLSVHLCYKEINIDSFFKSYRNIGIVLSILCIVEQITKVHFFDLILGKGGMYSEYYYRVQSIFGHAILCGVFLVILILVLHYYPYKNYYHQILANIVSILALLFTQTRSSWIACVICYAIILLKKNNIKLTKTKLVALLSSLFIGFILLITIGQPFIQSMYSTIVSRISGSLNAGEGQIVRIENLITSIEYWLDGNTLRMIFGTGKNGGLVFMHEHPISKFGGSFVWDSAIDNQYLTLIHETGLIGFGLFLYVVFTNIKELIVSKNDRSILLNSCMLSIDISLFFFEGFNYLSIVLLFLILYMFNSKNKELNEI